MLLYRLLFSLLFAACLGNELPQTWPIPDDIPATRVIPKVGCEQAGYQCLSCSQLSMCIETSTGFTEFEVATCDVENGEYCSRSAKECTTKKSFCSTGREFSCGEPGVYPDPYDCNVFYNCSLEGGVFIAREEKCTPGTAYNPKTFACDLTDSDPICKNYSVPECPETGLAFLPVPKNPNIFYACQNGFPQFFRCLQGEDYVFDAKLFICVHKDQQTPEPEPIIYLPEECAYSLYAHVPYTCHFVQHCSQIPYSFNSNCSLARNYYYDREKQTCTTGKCPYPDTWHLACPTTKLRPVAFSCTLFYNCTATEPDDYIGFCKGHFDREAEACSPDPKCPYTDL